MLVDVSIELIRTFSMAFDSCKYWIHCSASPLFSAFSIKLETHTNSKIRLNWTHFHELIKRRKMYLLFSVKISNEFSTFRPPDFNF